MSQRGIKSLLEKLNKGDLCGSGGRDSAIDSPECGIGMSISIGEGRLNIGADATVLRKNLFSVKATFKTLTGLMRPIHIAQGYCLFKKSTVCSCCYICKMSS